jgi:hypothetical protein
VSVETQIYAALKNLVGGRVYRDEADETVPTLPRIVFWQVGGPSINYLDSATIPDKGWARVQINCWHTRRDDCNTLAKQVENTLRAVAGLQTTVEGAFFAIPPAIGQDPKVFGTSQDFTFFA